MENIETKQNKQDMIELSMDCNDFGMTMLNHTQLCRKPNNTERTSCAFFNSFKTLVDILSAYETCARRLYFYYDSDYNIVKAFAYIRAIYG